MLGASLEPVSEAWEHHRTARRPRGECFGQSCLREVKRNSTKSSVDASQPIGASKTPQIPARLSFQTCRRVPARLDPANHHPPPRLNPHSAKQPAPSFNAAYMRPPEFAAPSDATSNNPPDSLWLIL
ncbi:hypothetical protein DXT89_24770 [Agrobacterium vitis]|uniref:Uncharacterized protein n=1 Tax=Agrobacterium vitis TaxID=373 RepID=A0A368NJ48_AGRVI|nr:hypothetical protein DXM22_23775 [Agrobacterium vitis]KAA3520793.1 hypothetical protein DXT89_24770 [Agrobacterium vitis]RCU50627.1 hypothetical protein ASB66_021185 [Agrobacterium vitis]